MAQKFLMPKAGQTMEEGIIVSWLKKEGDNVEKGEPVMVIQTDKADLEVESTASGVLLKMLYEEGDSCPVLKTVAVIGEKGEKIDLDSLLADEGGDREQAGAKEKEDAPAASPSKAREPEQTATPSVTQQKTSAAGPCRATPTARNIAGAQGITIESVEGSGISGRIMKRDVLGKELKSGRIAVSPCARRLAAENSITLSALNGTGPRGRIIKRDVESYMRSGKPSAAAAPALGSAAEGPETFELTGMRKAIAGALQLSKQQTPHFYATRSIDMTRAFAFKNYLKETGRKITVNDLVTKAVVMSLARFPRVNCRIEEDRVTVYPNVNLGIAVGLEEGLVVPVVVDAHRYSLEDLASESRKVINAAREGKLTGTGRGTFTVTNLGMFGVESFSAIINPPEGGILAVGAAKDTLVVKDQAFSMKKVMSVTVSVDHRVIDGILAAKFLNSVKELLETPEGLA